MSKNKMITLPSEVVERALAALDAEDPYRAAVALRAALEQSQGEQAPVAWCALNADRSGIAYFDGRPIIMTGPIGNEHHPDPLYTKPQPKPTPYLYYDPDNGDTWTQEAINDGCCLPDGLIALYTK